MTPTDSLAVALIALFVIALLLLEPVVRGWSDDDDGPSPNGGAA